MYHSSTTSLRSFGTSFWCNRPALRRVLFHSRILQRSQAPKIRPSPTIASSKTWCNYLTYYSPKTIIIILTRNGYRGWLASQTTSSASRFQRLQLVEHRMDQRKSQGGLIKLRQCSPTYLLMAVNTEALAVSKMNLWKELSSVTMRWTHLIICLIVATPTILSGTALCRPTPSQTSPWETPRAAAWAVPPASDHLQAQLCR